MSDDNDSFKVHQSKAGKIGGRSRSIKKIMASRANLAKVRQCRHNPVTGPQPIQSGQSQPGQSNVSSQEKE